MRCATCCANCKEMSALGTCACRPSSFTLCKRRGSRWRCSSRSALSSLLRSVPCKSQHHSNQGRMHTSPLMFRRLIQLLQHVAASLTMASSQLDEPHMPVRQPCTQAQLIMRQLHAEAHTLGTACVCACLAAARKSSSTGMYKGGGTGGAAALCLPSVVPENHSNHFRG